MMAEAVRPKTKKKKSSSKPHKSKTTIEPLELPCDSLETTRVDDVNEEAHGATTITKSAESRGAAIGESTEPAAAIIVESTDSPAVEQTTLKPDDVAPSPALRSDVETNCSFVQTDDKSVRGYHQSSTAASTSTSHAGDVTIYADAFRVLQEVTAEQVSMPSYHPLTVSSAPPPQQIQREEKEEEEEQATSQWPPDVRLATPKEQLIHPKIGQRDASAKTAAWEATSTIMRPFTEAQLCSIYCNLELEANDRRIDHFISKHSHPEGHEFHELLLGYLRARTDLISSTKAIEELKQSYTYKSEHVWEDQQQTAKSSGRCRDGNIVSGSYDYVKAVFNTDMAAELENVLRSLQTTLHDTYVLHSYEAEMSRLQVESYLYRVIGSSPVLRDIPRNAPVQVHYDNVRHPAVTAKVEEIQRCISILFAFQRRGIRDQQFVLDSRNWLQKLVAIVHRLGTFEDHLVLLNHVLRCPPGVSSWAANYLQVPFILHSEGPYPIGGPFLDHCFTILSTLLLPIRAREAFLRLTSSNATNESERDESAAWVVVDSEGEEDEDPANQWIHWRENDLVALLNQIPLGSLFRHLLAVFNRDGVDYYDVRHLNDQELMRIFSVVTQLVNLLRQGFKTFALTRYRQFAKRMSQVIRHAVMHVTDHLQQFFVMYPHLPPHIRNRLQVEYDQFFLRSTYSIFSSERLGAWQFMATMPYDCVSVQMLWKIIWLLHNDYKDDVAAVEDDLVAVDCRAELGDRHMDLKFEERLSSMPENEVYYLLTTFANMAIARTVEDYELIAITCTELFQISFLNERSKSQCYKWGRELLGTISTKHPFAISIVLGKVATNIAKLGKVSIYLFQELPLHLWQPTVDDMNILSALIKDNPPSTPANQLGQMIISNMNWDLNEKGDRLFLHIDIHRQTALAILDAHQQHIPFGKGGFLSESYRQVSSLAMAMRSCTSPDETFVVWCWETAFTLRLHSSQRPARVSDVSPTPDVTRHPSLANLNWCLQMRHPLAVYVAFAMSNLGHVQADFCQRLDVLQRVLDEQYYEAVVQILSHVIPLFFECGYLLWSNKTFLNIIETLLNCDSSYLKMAKSLLVSTFPGKILQTLASVIEHHLRTSSLMSWTSGAAAVMWTELLTSSSPQWHRAESVQYLLDTVFTYCFLGQDKAEVQRVIAHKFMNEIANPGADSTIISFLSWMATGSGVPPTLVNKTTASKYHWLAYGLLEIETQNEQQTRIWKNVLSQLAADASATPGSVVKRAAAAVEVSAPPVGHLPIYRWAMQALEVPNDHPLLPLFWQKFFGFFLQRSTATSGGLGHGSVGERFFVNMSTDVPLLKRMKKRLEELVVHHRNLGALATKELASSRGSPQNSNSDSPVASAANNTNKNWQALFESAAFHEKLTKLYRTFYLWLEEPRLHDSTLRLEALMADYDSARLVLLFQNNQDPWLEFVNVEQVAQERQVLTDMWTSRGGANKRYNRSLCNIRGGGNEPRDSAVVVRELLKRMQSYDEPLPPPPLPLWRPAIPGLPDDLCESPRAALDAVAPHLTMMTDYARTFANRLSGHTSLDCAYLDLLPQIYRNIETEVFLQVACHKGHSSFQLSSDSGCLGPANISLRFHEKKVISSALTKLDQNRADWLGVLNEGLLGTPQNVCMASVFIETVISQLLNKFNSLQAERNPRAANVRAIGLNVFYHLCGCMDTFTESYPPSRQFLTSCCEILGKELVRSFGDQCDRLLQMVLDAPHLSANLGPHFCPNAANSETFVRLYSRCSGDVLTGSGVQLALVVLSKFDVAAWLLASHPSLSERCRMVGCLEQALFGLGTSPAPQFAMIDELFRQHLTTLLLYQFPDLYREVFGLLFKGVERLCLAPQVWYDLLNAIVATDDAADKLSDFSSLQSIADVCRRFGETQDRFTLQELQDTLENVGQRFAAQRLATRDNLIFTLYTRNCVYVRPVAIFLGLIGQAYLVAIKKDASRSLPNSAIVHVWTVMRGAFSPWILPLEHEGKVWLPWVAGQEPLATYFVTIFATSIQYASKTLYSSCSVLSLFLDMYAREYATANVKEHIWDVCHRVFAAIEWNTFWPDPASVQLMTEILNRGLPECTRFLSGVFSQIGWPQVVHGLVQQGDQTVVVRTLACLLHLHVRLDIGTVASVTPTATRNDRLEETVDEQDDEKTLATRMRRLLEAAHAYPWHLLDESVYDGAVRLFVINCRPACVLGEVDAGRQDDAVLGLLQTAAEFVPGAATTHPAKRLTYVRTCVQLLCECSTKHRQLLNKRMELFKDVVSGLLVQIEVVLATGSTRTNVFDEAVGLTTEVLNVLNVATVVCLQDLAMKAVQDWIRAHPRSPILGACLRAASLCLASLAHMANVIEAVIDSYFSIEPDAGVAGIGWEFIHSVMRVPELSQQALVAECLRDGQYLTLNALAGLLRLQCRSPEQDWEQVVAIVRWLDNIKPREDNEHKLLLLWWRVIDGVDRLSSGLRASQVIDALSGMSGTLSLLGEDKSSQGLLGAIGFGRRSPLSLRMRFCARALNAVILLNVVNLDQKSSGSSSQLDSSSSSLSGARSQRSRQAALALTSLDQTKTNRQYSSLREQVEHVIHLTKRTVVTLKDVRDLLKYMVAALFPDQYCLKNLLAD